MIKEIVDVSPIQKIEALLLNYGYTKEEFSSRDDELSICNVVHVFFNKKKNEYEISFCSSADALGAANLVQHLNDNNIKNIVYTDNFYITDDNEIFYGEEADQKFRNELSTNIIKNFINQENMNNVMANNDDVENKVFH